MKSVTEELLKQKITEQQELINQFRAEFERISELTLMPATVISIQGKYAIMSNGSFALNENYEIGGLYLLHPQTGQVVQKVDHSFIGDLYTIDGAHDGYLTITVKGERRICYSGKHQNIKVGDIVLLDPSLTVVTFVVEKAKSAKAAIAKVAWNDIGGHEEAKSLLREAIELPHKYPTLYQSYQKAQASGILLYGPPGTGKTLLGKATAHAVGSDDGFLAVKGPELLNEYVGVTERSIRNLFTKARIYKEKHERPAVIFIDEAEALLSSRTAKYNHMGQTVVPTFLAEMDGLADKSAIVLLSTNRRDMLDEAIIREGRIDHKVEIKRPDKQQAQEIFSIHIRHKPIMKGHDKDNLVQFAVSTLYQHNIPHSGALIAGCVDKAVTHALRRDVAKGHVSGLCEADFTWATDQIIQQEVAI